MFYDYICMLMVAGKMGVSLLWQTATDIHYIHDITLELFMKTFISP